MSVFEKIKQLFKNIGNKQKLLESPKEIREEMSDMVSSNKKESKFLEDIKFDSKDLLDPRVCNGKDLVPNILRTLGADEDVVNNPHIINELRPHVRAIARQSGIEMPGYYEQTTRDDINAIVEAVKANGIVTTSRERAYKHPGLYGSKTYRGISIDQETGAVTIQDLNLSGKHANTVHKNYSHEKTFISDGKGNVVNNLLIYDIDLHGEGKAILNSTNESLYNSDGIIMKTEGKTYEQEETIVNNTGHGSPVGTEYGVIKMEFLDVLGNIEFQEDENGKRTPIRFDDRAQISKYYQENKEIIDNALMQGTNSGLFYSEDLKQSINEGIKKLAIKAGILPNGHKQEIEIA